MTFTTERPKLQRVHVTVYDPDKRGTPGHSKTVTLYGVTVTEAVRAITAGNGKGRKPAAANA